MKTAPKLSLICPVRWDEMSGDDSSRLCAQCGCHIRNISLLSDVERSVLLDEAKSQKTCVVYFQRLNGELVTPQKPLNEKERKRLFQVGASAVAIGALALSGCDTFSQEFPQQTESITTHEAEETKNEEVIELFVGTISEPEKTRRKGPRSRRI